MCARKKTTSVRKDKPQKDIRKKLMEACDELPSFERDILEILSLLYMPSDWGKIVKGLKECGVRDANNRLPTRNLIKKPIVKLIKLGLIEVNGQRYSCARAVVELITRRMVESGRFSLWEPIVFKTIPYELRWGGKTYFHSVAHALAHTRLAFYSKNFKRLDKVMNDVYSWDGFSENERYPLSEFISNPFDGDWFEQFPLKRQGVWLIYLLQDCAKTDTAPDDIVAYAWRRMTKFPSDNQATLHFLLAEIALMQGDLEEEPSISDALPDYYVDLLRARRLLLSGSTLESIALYESCLAMIKKSTRKRKPKFETIDWVFFILALLDAGDAHWPRALELAQWGASDNSYYFGALCVELKGLIKAEIEGEDSEQVDPHRWRYYTWKNETSRPLQYIGLLLACWKNRADIENAHPLLEEIFAETQANGYTWFAAEYAAILHKTGCVNTDYKKLSAELHLAMGTRSLTTIIKPMAPWERTLKALARIKKAGGGAKGATEKEVRLVWFVSAGKGHCHIQPKEQKCSAKGRWTKGRNIALRRLHEEGEKLGYLTDQDLRVCKHIVVDMNTGYWGRSGVDYYFPTRALTALVGHPRVFLMDTTINVDVVAATPELQVTKNKRALKLTMNPPKPENDDIYVECVGDSRIVVYEYTPEICQVAKILGKGVEAPAKAKEDVLKAVGNVSSMVTVHSDIGIADESIPKVDADVTPLLQLLPSGEGLIVQLRIQPLPDGGPLFPPGSGGTAVIAEVEGTRIQTERNFEAEKKNADEVIAACATLSNAEAWEGEWQLDEPESCLEFLMELEACEVPMRVQWPKGQNYNIQGSAGMGQFRAKINGGHNWFELSGEVKVDDDLVLDMQRLLELTETSKSRFVDLGNGQFLALTRAFRKKLDELRGLGEMGDKGLRMHALAAPALDDLVEQAASVKANKKWKDQVQRLQKARELDPKIPSTLQATLRDYQIDGYKWLARLAEWGVGACLADDMGLGKTVQILAVMLERATDGPQLVIAPTSVCMNWEDEARRFAPTLKMHRFGMGDREELMRDLGAFDVVVASYGLLHSESALFKDVDWQTIVLDEAQAIKNMTTKRSKAAMDLNGAFKIIATGTPIENHLGELWNLYRFINPGFLGSLDRFNEKFALPIEKYQDKDTRQHLRQLIQPFILRRLKGDVLDELPPRTDIVLHVELSKKERAFYEAIRQQALKNLSDVKAEPGKHHVRILAEIMRLRRACCNTQLVDEKSTLPSAKLEVFEAVLDELLENRHKALVFSQFVGHLDLLRALLDKKGISYQYLDGTTPAKKRKKSVDAFQAGEGDLFLISLKAGGVGLNLTAADYVIHMDPWWNPAVEDQASDRAHRIGQQRPVTVYRLVAKDTIEDQIVDLHHQKRDLANSLLEGSDMAGKVTAEQLLALLKNN